MSVIRTIKAKEKAYVTLDTTALNDARLSFRAKGLHTYLMSKPDHWQVYIEQLEKHSPREGRDAIRSAMQELLDAGYIRRQRVRGVKGLMQGWTTTVYETPGLADEHSLGLSEVPHIALVQHKSPTTDYPTSDNPTSEQPTTDYPTSVQPSSANPQLVSIDLEKVLIVDPPSPPSEEHSPKGKKRTRKTPSGYSPGFEGFWQVYPETRRKGKAQAWALWQRDHLEAEAEDIIAKVVALRQYDAAFREGFEPEPHRWLKNKRYTDDILTGPPAVIGGMVSAKTARNADASRRIIEEIDSGGNGLSPVLLGTQLPG